MVKVVLLVCALIPFVSGISSGNAVQEPAPNPPSAPQASSTLKNPVKASAESQAKAKKTYGYDCAMCHGATGDGKTDLAKDMKLTLSDWTTPNGLAGKSDGDLFEIIRKGKDKMPPEEANRAKDDEVWNLVTYIRSMSKGDSKGGAQQATTR